MNEVLPLLPARLFRFSTRARLLHAAALAGLCSLLCAPGASAQSPDGPARSAADGVYTTGQAAQGETVFSGICGSCHGTTEFRGPSFRRMWSGRSVYDLFDQLRNTMPLDNPGGLSREQYTDVIAYLLKLNDYPAGATALPATDEGLRHVKF
jgi:mono/diheme cytochrome c family protein